MTVTVRTSHIAGLTLIQDSSRPNLRLKPVVGAYPPFSTTAPPMH
ncbi:hypothetical protein BH10PSE11_BH10PSE11_08280 [soil metagenome]